MYRIIIRTKNVIPYLEPSGNYNLTTEKMLFLLVIPYLEPSGNYNQKRVVEESEYGYTIPRTIRELQLPILIPA